MSPLPAASGGWRLDLLTLIAGASLVLAFAPFSLWYWAPVPMAVLFLTVREVGQGRAFVRGALFGIGQFGAGIFWIAESFQYNFVPFPLAVLATSALVLGLALYPACWAAVMARVGGGGGWGAMVGWPAGWVVFEWLRGTLFTGFTWLQLGLGQVDGPLGGWLPVAGAYGVSFLVAAVGGALARAVVRRTPRAWLPLVALLVLLGASATALRSRQWTEPDGPAVSVAVVQGNVPQDEKWRRESRAPTLHRYLAMSRPYWGVDLVVWPETAVPGLLPRMGPYLQVVEEEASAHGTEVLAGIPSVDLATRRPLNAVVKLGGTDRMSVYLKRHLVPFGEYLPWPGLLGPVVAGLGLTLSNFEAGPSEQPLLTAAGRPVGVSICYEVTFAPEVRRTLPEARLLVNVSNDAWFGDTIGPHQHLQIARVRAREAGRWLVRATNTGISAIIDPTGALRAVAPQFQPVALEAKVMPYRGRSPYVAMGDAPLIVLLAFLALLGRWVPRWASRVPARPAP